MGMVRSILHNPDANSTVATVQHVWELLIVTVNLLGSLEHSNALFSSLCRAVFNHYCQTKVMVIKESSEFNDNMHLDTAEETALAAE